MCLASNVGVGATNPLYPLEVRTDLGGVNATDNVLRLFSTAFATGTSNTALRIEKGNGYGGVISGYITQGVGSGLRLSTLNGGAQVDNMTLTNAGNVGIGTTNPSYQLTVTSNIYNQSSGGGFYAMNCGNLDGLIQGVYNGGSANPDGLANSDMFIGVNYNQQTGQRLAGTNHGVAQIQLMGANPGAGAIKFRCAAGGTGALSSVPVIATINTTGVGIGTTGPGYILEVSNSTASTSTSFLGLTNPYVFGFNTGLNIGSSVVYSSRWQGDGGSGVVEMCKIDGRKEQNANYGDSYLAFQTRYETNRGLGGAGTLTEKMRISGNGNVGIGITNPTYALDVNGGYSSYLQYGGVRAPSYTSASYTTGTISNGANGTYTPNILGNYGGIFYFTVIASDNGSMFSSGIAYNWNPNLQSLSVLLTAGGVAVDGPAGVLRITNNTGAARSFVISILNTKP